MKNNALHRPNIDASFFREKTSNEKSIALDVGYLTGVIESWWEKNKYQGTHTLKSQLASLFTTYLRSEDIFHFDKAGLANGAAAVCINHIFSLDSPKLAKAPRKQYYSLDETAYTREAC